MSIASTTATTVGVKASGITNGENEFGDLFADLNLGLELELERTDKLFPSLSLKRNVSINLRDVDREIDGILQREETERKRASGIRLGSLASINLLTPSSPDPNVAVTPFGHSPNAANNPPTIPLPSIPQPPQLQQYFSASLNRRLSAVSGVSSLSRADPAPPVPPIPQNAVSIKLPAKQQKKSIMSFFKRANSTPVPTLTNHPATASRQTTATTRSPSLPRDTPAAATQIISTTTTSEFDLQATSSNSSSSSTIAAADNSLNFSVDMVSGGEEIRLSSSRVGITPVPKLELLLPETAKSFFDDFSF
ncbi:hypothetical protein HK100_012140 [Physocladia obscura]|uniref:Uncharacterized protein n=1 Tax=Physocladia obscura TaxID=109957 RepID=A0AAD5T1N9_9FUNG|nr:hypothetical protein HK100_012140 [Physocladia obscura]